MENKYFTPDIEDIRVGYEFEYESKSSLGWVKCIVAGRNTSSLPKGLIGVDISIASDYLKQDNWIRVPYLTKEQIEAEGWETMEGYPSSFKKKNVIIEYSYQNKSLWVADNGYKILDGIECKDINTFRYICKLLNIK